MALSRRQLLHLAPLGLAAPLGAGALFSGRAQAAPFEASDRKFLFIFARGGWDPAWALAPVPGSDIIYVDPDARPEETGGISFLDHSEHRAVGSFFSTWASRCCLIHGVEVRSVTHDACRRIMFTGGADSVADDWPAIIAGAPGTWELPDVVLSGPAYAARYGGSVVRVGPDGQLSWLLDGTALRDSDRRVDGLDRPTEDAVAAWLEERAARFTTAASPGQQAAFGQSLQTSLDQRALVQSLGSKLDLVVESTGGYAYVRDRVQPAIGALALGVTRCGVIAHDGEWDVGWDTHSGISRQSAHYEVLFTDLAQIMDDLERTTGPGGGPLLDEVTVVVFSEMGRSPRLNATGGKDHWTFTSALLMGSGVAGGQVIGGYDEALLGQGVALESGEVVADGGTRLTSAHLGATLVALAGLDPDEHVPGSAPIAAALEDS